MSAICKIENSIFGSVLLSRLDVVKLFPKNSKLVFHQKSGNDKNANLFLAKTRRKSKLKQNITISIFDFNLNHLKYLSSSPNMKHTKTSKRAQTILTLDKTHHDDKLYFSTAQNFHKTFATY